MKQIQLFFVFYVILAFCACEFNQSVSTDFTTGAYNRGDGIGCDNVSILVNDTLKNTNKFGVGDRIELVFHDIKGLNDDNGRVYPGLSLTLLDGKTDTLVTNEDLLVDINEVGTDLSPLQLSANLTLNMPPKKEQDYQVHVKIWDKKGTGTYTYELPFSLEARMPDFSFLNLSDSIQ